MPRAAIGLLSLLALSGLSCAVFSAPPTSLPAVGAGPAQSAVQSDARGHDGSPDPFVATALGLLRSHRTGLTDAENEELARVIVAQSRIHQLDPGLVLAVIAVESRYDNFAISPVGAMGLMQVMPKTGEELAQREGIVWLGPHTLFDPIANVRLGVAYLRELSDRYGRLATALAAYNWGPGRIDRRLRRGTPVPKRYPHLVLQAYGEGTREDS